jgi:hypothetical protein
VRALPFAIRRALFPAAVLSILGALSLVSRVTAPAIARARPPEFVRQELTYFPTGRFLAQVCAGQREMVADILWLRAIQYYGEHRQTDRQYVWARHIFRVITALNPRFVEAYRFGALVLANDAMQPKDAVDMLKRGMHANPSRWEFPYDLAFHYFLHQQDLLAASYFHRAGEYPGMTDRVKRFAAFAYQRGGREERARALWTELLGTATNPASREIADRSLRSMDLDAALESIATAQAAHAAERGGVAGSVDALVASGHLRAAPQDPFGRGFLIDPATGRVHSLFRVEDTLAQTLSTLKQTIFLYRQQEGSFPPALDALTTRGYMTMIRLPEGFTLLYDPGTGEVTPVIPPLFARAIRGAA